MLLKIKNFLLNSATIIINILVTLIILVVIIVAINTNPGINNGIKNNQHIWDFLQGLGTVVALLALLFSLLDTNNKAKQDRIRFRLETSAYLAPIPVQDFNQIEEKQTGIIHNFELKEVVCSEPLRDSWRMKVWDIGNIKSVITKDHIYPYLVIKNKGKVNARNIKIEICGTVEDSNSSNILNKYSFQDKDSIVYENFESLEIDKSIILFAEKDIYLNKIGENIINFTSNFGIKISYKSDYIDSKGNRGGVDSIEDDLTLIYEVHILNYPELYNNNLVSFIHRITRSKNMPIREKSKAFAWPKIKTLNSTISLNPTL